LSKIKLARAEFKRLRNEIRKDDVRILYYPNKDDFMGSTRSRAYTYSLEKPPLIVIRKGRGITYLEIIGTLLHEYGHILDDRRYGTSARSALYESHMLDGSANTIRNYPKKAKYAILKTELIVESMIPKLWKRFKIKLPFDSDYWECEKAVTMRVLKYWLVYGKPPAKQARKKWQALWKQDPWFADEAYIRDLSGV